MSKDAECNDGEEALDRAYETGIRSGFDGAAKLAMERAVVLFRAGEDKRARDFRAFADLLTAKGREVQLAAPTDRSNP